MPPELRNRPREFRSTVALVVPILLDIAIYFYLCFHVIADVDSAKESGYFLPFSLSNEIIESPRRSLLFACCAIRSLSQAFYGLRIQNYYFPVWMAISISFVEFTVDLFILGFALVFSNLDEISSLDVIYLVLFLVGICIERGSEYYRQVWKEKPENKGKPYMEGMFAYVVHANYFGYCIWRFAQTGLTQHRGFQIVATVLFIFAFVFGDIPKQKVRNEAKYGSDWAQFYRNTPKLIPGIF